jgi:hypothetical protein
MMPRAIRFDGAVLPNTEEGTIIGKPVNNPAAAPAEVLRKSLRVYAV